MSMNFKLSKNLSQGGEDIKKIYSLTWSANLLRLAAAQASDKKIILYDESGQKREAIPTKPFKNSNNYTIKDIAFSPCSTKLAVAQSDCFVQIFNIGTKFGDKKTISNKYEQECQVTCMIWPQNKQLELFIGLLTVRSKLQIQQNKPPQCFLLQKVLLFP